MREPSVQDSDLARQSPPKSIGNQTMAYVASQATIPALSLEKRFADAITTKTMTGWLPTDFQILRIKDEVSISLAGRGEKVWY